ncbi:MAG: homoserine dehydrogenase [Methanobacteriota archaeon]|nr:MAG: homoserine dehydrogenase [Euryarchaeota archaeon]
MRLMLIGFGVVAQSFADMMSSQSAKLAREHGLRPRIVAIADSRGAAVDPTGIDIPFALKSKKETGSLSDLGKDIYTQGKSASEIIREVECEVVVEATPSELNKGEPGLTHVRSAMKEGRHVICVNKGPLALAMPALMELANHNGVMFKFSGTVGGGTPVLDLAKKCLEGCSINSIRGILNGTCNYILTKMASEGVEMKEALADAQKLGYAEADPTNDVGGFDSACKLVITSNYVMGTSMSIRDVDIKGITEVTMDDIASAKARGNALKLVGVVGEGAKVAPEEVPLTHPLNVSGTFNAITFDTDPAGEITLVGKGAGGMETASSVLRDLIEIRKDFRR